MKVLILGDANTGHLFKWVSGLKSKGVELAVFSLTPLLEVNAHYYEDVTVSSLNANVSAGSITQKTLYFKALPLIKSLHKDFNPDIVHAHYASSYGLLGALCGFQNYLISVWGTDVYVFPKSNRLYSKLLKFALSKADRVFSTSHDMALETKLYTDTPIEIIPFGVNLESFNFDESKFENVELSFATAKSLKPIYNIPLVVKVFSKLIHDFPDFSTKLFIAGDGPEMNICKEHAGDLTGKSIFFEGAILHKDMPKFMSDKHVLINIPDSESFGVSVIEASASGMAIIASNRGGLPEVVVDKETGILIEAPFEESLRQAILNMIDQRSKTTEMSRKGRKFVEERYTWNGSLEQQYRAYADFLNR